ncbi:hypothetical protein BL253_20265 [Pseudofrankia asymbiotica]|uniref:Uncharacterized protein n=1 Tax=Pseudofrankia asymbiotica TaxID=1834516 RepID=A0A1V2I8V3_9ACTN|nr:hypothetical protein BL253_20265 [Pseudofrankia asymbiotica]
MKEMSPLAGPNDAAVDEAEGPDLPADLPLDLLDRLRQSGGDPGSVDPSGTRGFADPEGARATDEPGIPGQRVRGHPRADIAGQQGS